MKEVFGADFLNQEFPLKDRSHFVPAIERAYSLVNQLYSEHDFLNWPVGKDIKSYLRNVAVEFEIKRLIESGKVQFECRLAKNKGRNYNHLEVLSNKCILTIHQIPNINKLPRPAVYRSNLSRHNQVSFFQIPDSGLYEEYDLNYALLVHSSSAGAVAVAGASLILPNADMNNQITKIDLLSEVKQHLDSKEIKFDDELKLEFKEFVEQQRVLSK